MVPNVHTFGHRRTRCSNPMPMLPSEGGEGEVDASTCLRVRQFAHLIERGQKKRKPLVRVWRWHVHRNGARTTMCCPFPPGIPNSAPHCAWMIFSKPSIRCLVQHHGSDAMFASLPFRMRCASILPPMLVPFSRTSAHDMTPTS